MKKSEMIDNKRTGCKLFLYIVQGTRQIHVNLTHLIVELKKSSKDEIDWYNEKERQIYRILVDTRHV